MLHARGFLLGRRQLGLELRAPALERTELGLELRLALAGPRHLLLQRLELAGPCLHPLERVFPLLLRQRQPHSIGQSLPQRAGGGLNAGRITEFRMPWGFRAKLTKGF